MEDLKHQDNKCYSIIWIDSIIEMDNVASL